MTADLHSHAAYLRELRNYGIHPHTADPQASQEHPLTEAGFPVLLLATHRFLERIAGIVRD